MVKYLELCSKEQLKIIYDEFGITEESLKNDVNSLIEWMEKQPHLPSVKDEKWLTRFLICCKNSLEKTKQRLDDYYTARVINPEVFAGRAELISLARSFTQYMCLTPMPKLTKEGRRVAILRIFQANDFSVTSEMLLNTVQMVYDVIIKEDNAGQYIFIYDMENVTLSLLTIMFPAMKQFIAQITKILPFRIHQIYALNVSPVAEPLMNLGVSLLSKKLASRFTFWKKKPRELSEAIDEKILPPEYGGTEKPIEELRNLWVDNMFTFEDWLKAEESIKADLSKKPINNGSFTDLGEYGVTGSFRKMNLD